MDTVLLHVMRLYYYTTLADSNSILEYTTHTRSAFTYIRHSFDSSSIWHSISKSLKKLFIRKYSCIQIELIQNPYQHDITILVARSFFSYSLHWAPEFAQELIRETCDRLDVLNNTDELNKLIYSICAAINWYYDSSTKNRRRSASWPLFSALSAMCTMLYLTSFFRIIFKWMQINEINYGKETEGRLQHFQRWKHPTRHLARTKTKRYCRHMNLFSEMRLHFVWLNSRLRNNHSVFQIDRAKFGGRQSVKSECPLIRCLFGHSPRIFRSLLHVRTTQSLLRWKFSFAHCCDLFWYHLFLHEDADLPSIYRQKLPIRNSISTETKASWEMRIVSPVDSRYLLYLGV